ncbi:MAG: type II secretion system major pseudopilin GspG [Synergistaceae bacterium]|jgi:general secretion pathway protein G|nr:type II secretion system major pseudopilin GspG [Synergistaceae bacterium]
MMTETIQTQTKQQQEKQKRGKTKLKKRPGFTLIEIMVVVVILGMLAAIVVPRIGENVEEARRTAAKTQIENFVTSLEMYRLHNGSYPTTQQGLDALVKKPTLAPVPKKYPPESYMSRIPDDPWGNPFIYRCPGEKGAFDVISTGRNGEEGGEGWDADITNHESA